MVTSEDPIPGQAHFCCWLIDVALSVILAVEMPASAGTPSTIDGSHGSSEATIAEIIERLETTFSSIESAEGSLSRTTWENDSLPSETAMPGSEEAPFNHSGGSGPGKRTELTTGTFRYLAPKLRISLRDGSDKSEREWLYTPSMVVAEAPSRCGQQNAGCEHTFVMSMPSGDVVPPIDIFFPWRFRGQFLSEYLKRHAAEVSYLGIEQRDTVLFHVLQVAGDASKGEEWVRLFIHLDSGLKLIEKHLSPPKAISARAEVERHGSFLFLKRLEETEFPLVSGSKFTEVVTELSALKLNTPISPSVFTLPELIGKQRAIIDDQRNVRTYVLGRPGTPEREKIDSMLSQEAQTTTVQSRPPVGPGLGNGHEAWLWLALVLAALIGASNIAMLAARVARRRSFMK